MQNSCFDPIKTPLNKGVNLIEASAGTGKTYTIAMLALRFVVEQNISLEKLLVVTFTKAATEELKDRIRARLAEAKRALSLDATGIDARVAEWLDSVVQVIGAESVKQRLDTALLTIDQASIFTIHGFCQRVLQERPLESGQLFVSDLHDSIQPIKQQCADDFWRRCIYPRTAWEAAILTATYATPDALLASVDRVPPLVEVYPALLDIKAVLADIRRYADLANATWQHIVDTLQASFADDKFKSGYVENFDNNAQELKAWLQGNEEQLPSAAALALLTESGLKEGLNGQKFRSTKAQSGDERKADYIDSLAIDTRAFDSLATVLNLATLALRRSLLETLRIEVEQELRRQNMLSFDSLITRLADSLCGTQGASLAEQLRSAYSVALIDEFQDTDDSQWCIFSSIFAAPSQYLYLIGDPKQAIYKFRGADIYSYLGAQQTAEYRYTLASNWRSHPQLVEAVNVLFRRQDVFFLEDLRFSAVTPGLSAQKGQILKAGLAIAPTMLWQLPASETSKGYWSAGKAGLEIRNAVVREVIDLLSPSYCLHVASPTPKDYLIQPKDIAILVRNNRQAREYQQALRKANVPSVLNSMESVFASQEAIDLYTLLRAVANPGDAALFKQAMTLAWFGLDGQAFYRFVYDETAMDEGMGRFFLYHQVWQKSGLMAMMLQLLAQENVKANLSTTRLSERQLTNIQHLLELVQQAVVDERLGVAKTVDWLHTAITQASASENQQLRLESDDNAVRIVTTHRSKGLEYHIVFCPYLWYRNSQESDVVVCHEQGRMVADLGSEDFSRRRLQALGEELAEDLRVLYVAITRAKYRCYLAWADARTEKSANQSAMAWLLEFADSDQAGQQALLQSFKNEYPHIFDYQLLDLASIVGLRYQKSSPVVNLQAKKRTRALYTSWQMSSYTALSALAVQEIVEGADDKVGEEETRTAVIESPLPRGAQTGNVVHALLEGNSFAQLAGQQDISTQIAKACLRFGLRLEQPELLQELLQAVVATPLSTSDPDFCLMHVQDRHCLKEMPFYLSLKQINTAEINRLLADSPVYQPLQSKQIAGFLTGFIDLVCEYKGRYYVMDYKTNTLPEYTEEAIVQAMREHSYGLQYWLYTVVLHRYLQVRLPGYSYQQHFGGVRYLFVRGMQPDVVMSGVYEDRPEFAKVEALAGLFGG